jgi:hypothetical protein
MNEVIYSTVRLVGFLWGGGGGGGGGVYECS